MSQQPKVTLQLFPPPEKKPKRQTSRRYPVKPEVPQPVVERKDSAKSLVDFHELVVPADAEPSSASISRPPKVFIQTSPIREFDSGLQISHGFLPPPPPLPSRSSPPEGGGSTGPFSFSEGSPTPSGKLISPVESIQDYRGPSPSPSGSQSFRSSSPTLVRSNSAATNRNLPSPSEEVPIRSIFPVYNPSVPLTHQRYMPTQRSPDYIPKEKISRSPYSANFYTPYGDSTYASASSSSLTTYYTPATALDSLWDAANGQATPKVQLFTLQMHRPTASSNPDNAPQVSFGPTPYLPFYSLLQAPLGESALNTSANFQELLIQRHHPTKPNVFPVSHLSLSIPSQSGGFPSDYNPPLDAPIHVAELYPKLAAISALEAAANSPIANSIASFDPQAQSPAAQRLAEEVLRGSAERETCNLTWTCSPPNPYCTNPSQTGIYSLHHPSLGIFPISIEGDVSAGFFSASPKSRRPHIASISLLRPIASPASSASPILGSPSPSASKQKEAMHPEDKSLARLDFATDSLVINVSSILAFNNVHLIDIIVSALLCIASAEEKRLAKGRYVVFDGPPTPAARSEFPKKSKRQSTGLAEKEKKKSRWSFIGKRDFKGKVKELDLEAPRELPQDKEAELHWIARGLLGVLRIGFKTIFWLLSLSFKLLAGLVVAANKYAGKL